MMLTLQKGAGGGLENKAGQIEKKHYLKVEAAKRERGVKTTKVYTGGGKRGGEVKKEKAERRKGGGRH